MYVCIHIPAYPSEGTVTTLEKSKMVRSSHNYARKSLKSPGFPSSLTPNTEGRGTLVFTSAGMIGVLAWGGDGGERLFITDSHPVVFEIINLLSLMN